MYLNIPQEDLDKKRIDLFLLRSLAAALFIGSLLIAGALLMPESLQLERAQSSTVSGGPIQTSLTMINSMERMQKRNNPVAETSDPCDKHITPARLLQKALSPLAKYSSISNLL